MLSLPFAFHATGLVGGILLCILVGYTEAMTLYVLSKFAERYEARTYVELVRRALGRKAAVVLSVVLLVSMAGACIAYTIIMADNLSSLAAAGGLPAWAANRRHIVLALSATLFPLCLPRNLTALDKLNQVAILGFLFGAGLVVYRGFQVALEREHLLEGVSLFRFDRLTLHAIPIVVFGFNCHSTVVSVYSELEPAPGLLVPMLPPSPSAFRRYGRLAPQPGSRKLVGMLGVILISMACVGAIYVVVGISGYLAFPQHVDSNILVTFPEDDPLLKVARGFVALIVYGSWPLTHHPARAGFEHLTAAWVPDGSAMERVVSVGFTAAFVAATAGVALVVTDLGIVLHLLGGLCISFIIFFLPGLLLVNAAIVKWSKVVLEQIDTEAILEEEEHAPVRYPSQTSKPLAQPLLEKLQTARDKGIKKTGIMYAPRLSWTFGVLLIALSLAVASVALYTVIYG